MLITDFLNYIMAPAYEVNFEVNLITGRGYQIQESPRNKNKCYKFLINNEDSLFPNSVKLVPKTNMKVEWLYGPAVTLDGRQVIYPCTRFRCVVPCPCLLCRKQQTFCLVPTNQTCTCIECGKYFQDHSYFHGTFHFGCRSCYQIAQIFPAFNFFFLNNDKKERPSGSYCQRSIKTIIVNIEPKAPKSWLNYLPASVIIKQHAIYGKQGMQCIECDILYWSMAQLREHIERNHMISRVFEHHYVNTVKQAHEYHECKECKTFFVSSSKLNRHLESVLRNEKFTCNDCGKQFTREDNLLRHVKALHETISSDKPTCKFCEETFNCHINLKRHLKNILDKNGNVKYACTKCEEEFCTAKFLAAHCRTMHSSEEDLNMHITSVHIPETHVCDICSKSFSREDNLIRHQKIKHSSQNIGKQVHHPESTDSDMFKCEFCSTIFTIKTNLQNHTKNIYNSDRTVKNICDQCEKKFCTGKQLKAHILLHQTTISCERCGQTFTLKKSLDLHIKTRINTSCNQCGNSFCNIISLKKHMKGAHGIQMKVMKK